MIASASSKLARPRPCFSWRTGWRWGDIKTAFDCTLLPISATIGFIFLGRPEFIREGTFMNAILVGQYIELYFFLF
ncbi:hypothetical protein ACFSHT_29680 [Paraburkholderia silviterrae]|uniref:Uncharacterized protein n=1 Tax=Paraburkholderia silviterrae TaxID=2528715 RepID=A0A4R5M7F2_9BURK|nr:hypothetical protein [Paraburkholderia silviterrae]TDG22143.1 hypothetical protein EYW47_19895 [Paraburkholderia silviterrae]